MMAGDLGSRIQDNTRNAGKTYAFDQAHDATRPAQVWFQESDEGLVLFLVFYTLACRWSRCLGCNLPSKMSLKPVPFKAQAAQVDHVFQDPEVVPRFQSIRQVIVSNNGSVLDEATFSSTALMYLLARLNLHVPNLSVVTLETRPEYVDLPELEFIARAMTEGDTPTQLEIAIGFEAFDDHIRNEVYHKGLELAAVERLTREMAPFRFRLKCYFMQKPAPGMSDAEAIADIHRAIDYLSMLAHRYRIPINLHLCPTYVAAGTPVEAAFRDGSYTPPRLRDVARAALRAHGTPVSVYIALFDEGLAVEGGSFLREGDEASAEALRQFNRTQDFSILEKVGSSWEEFSDLVT